MRCFRGSSSDKFAPIIRNKLKHYDCEYHGDRLCSRMTGSELPSEIERYSFGQGARNDCGGGRHECGPRRHHSGCHCGCGGRGCGLRDPRTARVPCFCMDVSANVPVLGAACLCSFLSGPRCWISSLPRVLAGERDLPGKIWRPWLMGACVWNVRRVIFPGVPLANSGNFLKGAGGSCQGAGIN